MPPVLGPASPSKSALVVLGGSQRQDLVAADDGEQGDFLALEKLLDEHAYRRRRRTGAPRSTRPAPPRPPPASWATMTPLPAARPSALTTTGAPCSPKVGQGRLVVGEGGRPRRWARRRLHDLFGEGLGAFQPGAVGPRTEHREAALAQLIGQAGHQRRLRPHHRQVDLLPLHEGDQAGRSSAADVRRSRRRRAMPALPGRADQPPDPGALGQAAHERMLPGASADYQYIQTPSESHRAVLLVLVLVPASAGRALRVRRDAAP